MTDKRRKGVLGTVFADPWRKAAAVLLATGLWWFVDSRIEGVTTRKLALVTVGADVGPSLAVDRLAIALPTDRVVGQRFLDGEREVDSVTVVIRGPRFLIDDLQERPIDLQITRFLTLDWSTRSSVEFTSSDLRLDQLVMKDLHFELRPSRIRLVVENIVSRPFPLSLDAVELIEGPFEGRLRRETAEFTQEAPVVLGKAFGIDQLGKLAGKRFRATMSSGNDRQVTGQIEIVGGADLGVRFETPPLLTMQLKPVTRTFDLEIPVVVDDQALPPDLRGQWLPETRSRSVRIRAGGDLRSRLVGLSENIDKAQLPDWVAENLRLHVHIQRPAPGAILGPVLDLRARLLLLGPLHATVDRNECLLDEPVVVKLRRQS